MRQPIKNVSVPEKILSQISNKGLKKQNGAQTGDVMCTQEINIFLPRLYVYKILVI